MTTLVRVIVHEPTGSLCADKDGSFTGSVDCSNHPDFRLKCQHGQEAVIKTLELRGSTELNFHHPIGPSIGRCDICRAWTSRPGTCDACRSKFGHSDNP